MAGIACDAAEKVCGCSSKGVSACVSVPNSSCDGGTDSCTCNINYFRSNAGACEQAPSKFRLFNHNLYIYDLHMSMLYCQSSKGNVITLLVSTHTMDTALLSFSHVDYYYSIDCNTT